MRDRHVARLVVRSVPFAIYRRLSSASGIIWLLTGWKFCSQGFGLTCMQHACKGLDGVLTRYPAMASTVLSDCSCSPA